jgi:hypothetical protein
MFEGIGSALVHPLNTVQGLGKIANMGSLLPSIDTFKELGGKQMGQVEGGAAKGLFSMVEGIGSAVAHPLNAVQGLGKIANMGSLLPSSGILKELGNFGKDVLGPSGSSKDAVKNLWQAGQDKQEKTDDQT